MGSFLHPKPQLYWFSIWNWRKSWAKKSMFSFYKNECSGTGRGSSFLSGQFLIGKMHFHSRSGSRQTKDLYWGKIGPRAGGGLHILKKYKTSPFQGQPAQRVYVYWPFSCPNLEKTASYRGLCALANSRRLRLFVDSCRRFPRKTAGILQSELSGETLSPEAHQNLLRKNNFLRTSPLVRDFPFKVAANILEHSFGAFIEKGVAIHASLNSVSGGIRATCADSTIMFCCVLCYRADKSKIINRRVTPCAVKTCAVRPVFARVVGELRAADPSNVQEPVKQNARPGD